MEYKKPTAQMIEEFRNLMPGRVHAGEDISSDYAHDEMSFYAEHMPDLVVDAVSTEEISKVCKLCYENDVPFVPRGAGTGLSAGCVAIAGGVVINMSKMNKILGYDLDNFIVRAQAGAFVGDIQEDCARYGMLYPPDP